MRKLELISLLSFNRNKRNLLTSEFTEREKIVVTLLLHGMNEEQLSSYSYSPAEVAIIKNSATRKINAAYDLICHFNDSPNPLKEIFRDEDVFNMAMDGLPENEQIVLKHLYHAEDFDEEFENIAKTLDMSVPEVIRLYNIGKNNLKLYLN